MTEYKVVIDYFMKYNPAQTCILYLVNWNTGMILRCADIPFTSAQKLLIECHDQQQSYEITYERFIGWIEV